MSGNWTSTARRLLGGSHLGWKETALWAERLCLVLSQIQCDVHPLLQVASEHSSACQFCPSALRCQHLPLSDACSRGKKVPLRNVNSFIFLGKSCSSRYFPRKLSTHKAKIWLRRIPPGQEWRDTTRYHMKTVCKCECFGYGTAKRSIIYN